MVLPREFILVVVSSGKATLYQTDDAGLEKEKPGLQEVAADGTLAVIAGADTTSSALACLFYSLLGTPEVYMRLQAEIDSAFPDEESPLSTDVAKHSELPYLNACM